MKNERPGPKSGPKRGEKPDSKSRAKPGSKRDPRPDAEFDPKSGPKRGERPDSKSRAKPGAKREPRSDAEFGAKKDYKSDAKFGPKRDTGGSFSPKTKADKERLAFKTSNTPLLKTAEKPAGKPSGKPYEKSGGKTGGKSGAKPERAVATQAFPPKRYINVYFSLGSNMGDRQANLRAAALMIDKNIGKIARKSHVYETEPWGEPAQDKFLNQVIMANTTMTPRDLLEIITVIEKELGRVKKEKWGPRTIDIDILFYGKRVIRDKGLDIPHPELHKRNFILIPLLEIAPDLEHPVLKQPIDELYMASKDPGEVVQLD